MPHGNRIQQQRLSFLRFASIVLLYADMGGDETPPSGYVHGAEIAPLTLLEWKPAMEALIEWLKPLKTSMIIRYIADLNLLHNPWFIGGAVLFVVICLWLKWRLLLSCTLSLTGLIALVYFVHNSGTDLERSSDSLFIFVGGGAALVFLFIYLVFMRGD